MIVPMNISLNLSENITNEENSIINISELKEDTSNKNYELKNNNNIFKKNKKTKNVSMPNLFCHKTEKIKNTKNKNGQFDKIFNSKKLVPLIKLEKKIHEIFTYRYIDNSYYNIQKIDEIVNNEKSHLVAEFKDFLVIGDTAEFLQQYYSFKEIGIIFPQILEYYKENLFIFPNYVILPESKYIYLNIQKKQKIIDIQEEDEDRIKNINNDDKDMKTIFTHNEMENLLNQTDTSGIKQYFGINTSNTENSNGMDKNELQIMKLVDNISDYENNKNLNIQKIKTVFINHNKLNKFIKKEESNNNNNRILFKLKKNKIKKEKKNNIIKRSNSRNKDITKTLISDKPKNKKRLFNKRNNLSQPNVKNPTYTFNVVMLNSLNNKNIYKESSKNTKNEKEKLVKDNIRLNNKKQIKEKIHQNNFDTILIKKIFSGKNTLTKENNYININRNITEIVHLNKLMKINKNILKEINNYNNKNHNMMSSIKTKNYKKLLMDVLLGSNIRTLNDEENLKTNISKKISRHKNKYNSETNSIKDNYLTSTVNEKQKEKSISLGKAKKTIILLKNDNNYLKLGKIENPKKRRFKKNKLSASCKNMSINSYITKKLNNNNKNLNFLTNRNSCNHHYKLTTNKSNSKNINIKEINANIKQENKKIFTINKNNINKRGSKTLLDSYSTKEMSLKYRKSKDFSKNNYDFNSLKINKSKNKKPINQSNKLMQNKYIKKIKCKYPILDNNKGFPLTERKTKDEIDINLEKIEILSKQIQKMKEHLKKSAEKISNNLNISQKKYKYSKITENIENKNVNSNNNVIKVYLSSKTKNKDIKYKVNHNIKVNNENFFHKDFYNNGTAKIPYTSRIINSNRNNNKNGYQVMNEKNKNINIKQKSMLDNFNKAKYNTLINYHRKNEE